MALALTAGYMNAQENTTLPSRSLTVESNYNAEVTDAQKSMPVPEKPAVKADPVPVSYAFGTQPYSEWNRAGVQAISGAEPEASPVDGELKFSYGLFNDADGMLDIRYHATDEVTLYSKGAVMGWKGNQYTWKTQMLDIFNDVGFEVRTPQVLFDLHGGLGSNSFNYRPYGEVEMYRYAHLGNVVASVSTMLPGKFNMSLQVGYYRYSGQNEEDTGGKAHGGENLVRVNGNATYDLMDNLTIGAEGLIKYADYGWTCLLPPPETGTNYNTYDDFITAGITPYARWKNDDADVQGGFNLLLQKTVGPNVQLAPYVKASYRLTPMFTAVANVTGGLQDNDLRHLAGISPYWASQNQIIDGYEQLNASLGVQADINANFAFSLRGGYRSIARDVFQTEQKLYYVNNQTGRKMNDQVMFTKLTQAGSNNLYAEFEGRVNFTDRFGADLGLGWYKWSTDGDEKLLLMRPRIKFSCAMESRIWDELYGNISYRFERMSLTEFKSGNDMIDNPDHHILDFSIWYNITPKFAVSLNGNNMLDRAYFQYAGYEAIPRTITGGIIWHF